MTDTLITILSWVCAISAPLALYLRLSSIGMERRAAKRRRRRELRRARTRRVVNLGERILEKTDWFGDFAPGYGHDSYYDDPGNSTHRHSEGRSDYVNARRHR